MRIYKNNWCTVGELQTWIDIQKPTDNVNANGFPGQSWTSIWPNEGTAPRPCRWINRHGKEAWQSSFLGLREEATVTLRYDASITPECQVVKGTERWEIVSMDDVRERGRWLEMKIRRLVPAR